LLGWRPARPTPQATPPVQATSLTCAQEPPKSLPTRRFPYLSSNESHTPFVTAGQAPGPCKSPCSRNTTESVIRSCLEGKEGAAIARFFPKCKSNSCARAGPRQNRYHAELPLPLCSGTLLQRDAILHDVTPARGLSAWTRPAQAEPHNGSRTPAAGERLRSATPAALAAEGGSGRGKRGMLGQVPGCGLGACAVGSRPGKSSPSPQAVAPRPSWKRELVRETGRSVRAQRVWPAREPLRGGAGTRSARSCQEEPGSWRGRAAAGHRGPGAQVPRHVPGPFAVRPVRPPHGWVNPNDTLSLLHGAWVNTYKTSLNIAIPPSWL
jgi:hypothetical protein